MKIYTKKQKPQPKLRFLQQKREEEKNELHAFSIGEMYEQKKAIMIKKVLSYKKHGLYFMPKEDFQEFYFTAWVFCGKIKKQGGVPYERRHTRRIGAN